MFETSHVLTYVWRVSSCLRLCVEAPQEDLPGWLYDQNGFSDLSLVHLLSENPADVNSG